MNDNPDDCHEDRIQEPEAYGHPMHALFNSIFVRNSGLNA